MASFKEIVTKAVIGKGKKTFSNKYVMMPSEKPSTILGCWVINHTFKGYKQNEKIMVEGSCDINIWYSYDNDTKTVVAKDTINYQELLNVTRKTESDLSSNEEIIVRSLKQPSCVNVTINNGNIEYEIEKELGIEIVGDTKVRIAIDENEDEWDEIVDDDEISKEIDNDVKEEFLTDE
ncbi:MAG TPA: outer spore coat protein CotE [Bacilli bacterium]|nr:outer spore coat protein CotE [Bacilli bacterium]